MKNYQNKLALLICICLVILSASVSEAIDETFNPSDQPVETSETDSNSFSEEEDVEHLLDQAALKDFSDGPVQMEIIGDTTHLFADEDFEKKEVITLRDGTNATTDADDSINSTDQFHRPEICARSNLTTYRDYNTVQLVNGSHLTRTLSEANPNDCFLVLFYAPWCRFSVKLAPIYNALPKAFPNLDIMAFDVTKSIGYA
jgi:hypothetical protein